MHQLVLKFIENWRILVNK